LLLRDATTLQKNCTGLLSQWFARITIKHVVLQLFLACLCYFVLSHISEHP